MLLNIFLIFLAKFIKNISVVKLTIFIPSVKMSYSRKFTFSKILIFYRLISLSFNI